MDRLVLLITVDSLRADRVFSSLPNAEENRGLTPNIDSLAKNGKNYTAAFATGPGTRQSFPGILSSTPPLAYGGYNRFGAERPALAEYFQSAGFTTGAIHSNAQLSADFGYDRGFDSFHHLSSPNSGTEGEGSSTDTSIEDVLRDRIGAWTISHPRIHQRLKQIETRVSGINRPYATAKETRERASKWISNQSQDTFAWVHFMDVHVPYYPPYRYREETGCEEISNAEMTDLWQKLNARPESIGSDELSRLELLYNSTVRYVDEEIRKLIDAARKQVNGEPIIAFTADHGEEFRDHGGLTHSPQLHKELVHVPLMITGPDLPPETVSQPVSLMDIGPTLLSSIDQESGGMWGIDLNSELSGDHPVFSEVAQSPTDPNDNISTDVRITACRLNNWTYIQDGLRDQEKLYDRGDDPTEQEPLQREEISNSLREEVDRFRNRVDQTSPELLERDMSKSVRSRLENMGYLQE